MVHRDSMPGSGSGLQDKRVVVMGLGRFGGGVDAALYAAGQGARVLVTDLAKPDTFAGSLERLKQQGSIELALGGHREETFVQADVVIVNPAVAPSNRFLQLAREHQASITTQVNLFLERCPATVVGITGSNGKSTSAALTAHLLESALAGGFAPFTAVWLGGNIGNRPLLGCLGQVKAEDVVVLELSSFQTEMLSGPGRAPKICLVTNVTPNHLDRHGTFEAYCAAKERLFQLQRGSEADPVVSLFCGEDAVGNAWYAKYHPQPGRLARLYGSEDVAESLGRRFTLPGRANLNNLAAALAIAECLGLGQTQLKDGVASFKSLPHRLEALGEHGRVHWYNDSIATTPESTVAALDALPDPKVLILGGYDKGTDFLALGRQLVEKVRAVVLIGQTSGKIAEAILAAGGESLPVERAVSLVDAVSRAARRAEPGDAVILSPACASYDMFENFEARGNEFRRLVSALCE